MTLNDIIKIVSGIIVSLGGAGAIILLFSNFFGKFLAKGIEEKIRAKFQNDIHEFETQLEIFKQTTLRYSDKQFEYYSKLWSNLLDLKLLADNLWQEASSIRLEKFARQLKATKTEIEKASLFIEDNHYTELIKIIECFSEYQIGKIKLINYRQNQFFDMNIVTQMIEENSLMKKRFEKLINTVKTDLKKQIGGK